MLQSQRAALLAPIQRYKRTRVPHSQYPHSSVKIVKWVKLTHAESDEEGEDGMEVELEEGAEEELKKAVEAAIPQTSRGVEEEEENENEIEQTGSMEAEMTPSGLHVVSLSQTPSQSRSGVSTPLNYATSRPPKDLNTENDSESASADQSGYGTPNPYITAKKLRGETLGKGSNLKIGFKFDNSPPAMEDQEQEDATRTQSQVDVEGDTAVAGEDSDEKPAEDEEADEEADEADEVDETGIKVSVSQDEEILGET